MIKKLIECKKCDKHVSMKDWTVICGMHDDCNVVVFAMPSNWNPGIKNGVMIVDCKSDYKFRK